jgi:hypothetical protein
MAQLRSKNRGGVGKYIDRRKGSIRAPREFVGVQPGTPCECGHPQFAHRWHSKACRHINTRAMKGVGPQERPSREPSLIGSTRCDCTEFTPKGGNK